MCLILKKISCVYLMVLFGSALFAQQCPILPLPNRCVFNNSVFALDQNTTIGTSQTPLQPMAVFLQQELLRYKSLTLTIQPLSVKPAIVLSLNNHKAGVPGAYTLQMSAKEVKISAASTEGVFYGIISFLQLVQLSPDKSFPLRVGCWSIDDAPKYQWRGLMLDESRHFFGKQKVKSLLDWMAYYKLNRFHWHLTDEPGWRLEIKQYPKLTLVGGIGNYTDSIAPATYYTQDDIKEIVTYAAQRQITVIPEVDMPGHATALNKAYPEYRGGGSVKHPDFTINPGKEESYAFLTNILKEVDVLFPSKMIHIGGDEVSFGSDKWIDDKLVKNLMQTKNLRNIKDVEEYFNKRMADSVFKLNSKVLGWDEIAGVNLPADKTIIFWWRQDKPKQLDQAINKGYNVVLCPRLPFYFDFVQDSVHVNGRKWDGKFNSVQDVYNFTWASFAGLKGKGKQVLGIQANIWTETIATNQRLDYMLFPRICALAEAAWSKDDGHDYQVFKTRLRQFAGRLPYYNS